MHTVAQPIMMKLVVQSRRVVSTKLPGLLGALLGIAFPGIDITDQMRLYLLMWSGSAEVMAHQISRAGLRLRFVYKKLKCPRWRACFAEF